MTFKAAMVMMKPYKKRIAIIIAFSVIILIISAVTPFVNRDMIDNGILQKDLKTVVKLVFVIVVLQITSRVVEYFQRKQEVLISNEFGEQLKLSAFEHGLKLKARYFKEQGFFKTIGDALFDIGNIMSIANNNLFTIFLVVCKCLGAVVGLIVLDWRLFLVVLMIVPIKIGLNLYIRKKTEEYSKRMLDENQKYNTWFAGIMTGIIDIKLWNLEKKTLNEYDGYVVNLNEKSKDLSLLSSKNNALVVSFESILTHCLYILGAWLIVGDNLTYGSLVTFITFTSYMLSPIGIIMNLQVVLKQIKPSADSLKRFYDLEEENYGSQLPMHDDISTIEFKDVSLTLGEQELFKNLNLTINKGEKVAIVGENGSGKTSLMNLLMRLYDPTSGQILINGQSVDEINIESYRKAFSVVMQDVHLFQGTVKDNIIADEGVEDYKVVEFCQSMIEGLENGFDTHVGNDGAKLSGGERQKVAFLRALNRKARILVMDEPTSNYDMESENQFNDFIRDNTDFDFYFVITHRKEILESVDKVIMIGEKVQVIEKSKEE